VAITIAAIFIISPKKKEKQTINNPQIEKDNKQKRTNIPIYYFTKKKKQENINQKNFKKSINDNYENTKKYIVIYKGEGIKLKDEQVPMKLIIDNKSIDMKLPLATIKDPKKSFLIIKDKNSDTLIKLNPNFVNSIKNSDEVKIYYNSKNSKVTSIHIDDAKKNILKPLPQVGDLPNFSY